MFSTRYRSCIQRFTYVLFLVIAPSFIYADSSTQTPFYFFDGHPLKALQLVKPFLPTNPVIVEAGAYDGNDSCNLARTWPNGHIHSFEPVKSLFKNVSKNTSRYPNISAYNLALGTKTTSSTFYLSEIDELPNQIAYSSSLLPPKEHLQYAPWVHFGKTEIVEETTLDEWASIYGIEKIDFLWLDMQGYELPMLQASPNILNTVSVILTEVEFVEAYQDQPLFDNVKDWLESQGFVLIGGNFTIPRSPQQWYGDALFVRKKCL